VVADPVAIPELEDSIQEVLAVDDDLPQRNFEGDYNRDAPLTERVSRRAVEVAAGVGERPLARLPVRRITASSAPAVCWLSAIPR
jgi:hypothetical protein